MNLQSIFFFAVILLLGFGNGLGVNLIVSLTLLLLDRFFSVGQLGVPLKCRTFSSQQSCIRFIQFGGLVTQSDFQV